jgi:hypothetical protein
VSFNVKDTLTTPGGIPSLSFILVHIFLRGCVVANANGRGGSGGHEVPDHYESGGTLVPRAVESRDWD